MIKTFWFLFLMQLRDKLDFAWTKSTKRIIQTIVFSVLRFLAVAAIPFVILTVLASMSLILKRDVIELFVVFLTAFALMNLLSIILTLTKTLYCAEDNKVLAALPASASTLFFSKISVFLFFQFKRDLQLLIPVSLGIILYGVTNGVISIGVFFWCLIPLLLFSLASTMIGALLSVPFLYIYQFFRNFPVLELALFVALVAGAIVGAVLLIGLIPENIDLINQWQYFRNNMLDGIRAYRDSFFPIRFLSETIIGTQNGRQIYAVNGQTVLNAVLLLAVSAVLASLVYLLIKPFYFHMISKSFEIRKTAAKAKKNAVHKRENAPLVKEILLSLRDFGTTGTSLAVYIAAPILLLFMDKIFGAIATSLRGDAMIIGFNLLFMILPYLVSNSLIATFRSKQGFAVYMEKTTPLESTTPIIARAVAQMVLSLPSIAAETYVFAVFTNLPLMNCLAVGFAVLLMQYGHIFHALALDFMNPKMDAYAMDGESATNSNEIKAVVTGFLYSFAFAGLGLLFVFECFGHSWNYDSAWIRLLILSVAFFIGQAVLFILKVRAYYYEK